MLSEPEFCLRAELHQANESITRSLLRYRQASTTLAAELARAQTITAAFHDLCASVGNGSSTGRDRPGSFPCEHAVQLQPVEDASNDDLEALTETIADGLRGSLRAISAFADMLLEDCCETRPESDATRYARKISYAAKRTRVLVDGLLGLRCIAVRKLRRVRVDVSGLAGAIIERLTSVEPQECEVVIEKGLVAHADRALLEIALATLLVCALTLTDGHKNVRIELGARPEASTMRYHVRCDGIALEPARADLLFSSPNPNDAPDELRGAVLGYAIAERIIKHHGGRIQTEVASGAGAAFVFTLAPS